MAGRPDGGWLRAAPYRQFQQWCLQTYGDAGKTKTVTRRKYERIVQLLRGGEPASGDSAKFKFWVKSKGFQLATGNAVQLSLPVDTASARLYVPVKPPLGDDQVTGGPQALRQVAMVEDFFDIIYSVHVERASIGERVGRHAGQKRTYKAISETYAFLPREAVTKFLMSCSECQKRMHLNPRATEHKENERPWTLSGEIDYNLPITATYMKHLKLQSLEDGRQEDEELDSSTEELEMSVSTPTSEEPFLTSDTRRDDSSPASSPENDEDQSSDGLTECGGYTRVLDCGQGTRGNLANRSSFASGNGCEQPLNLSERTASKPARRLAVENTTVHWPQGLPCTPINTDPGHECDSSKRSPSNNLPYELHGRAEVVLEDGGSARGEEEEEEEHEEAERGSEIEGADPERLKAFNASRSF
uniref:Nucleolar protein 4 n=1 Tax=Eptatretus burgeri TaxID=7764 RepID=A0A8C4QYW3_EPTBU